ncbi:MAG: hypothetical protein IPM82_07475 [Saprospiraceae bacterium]|nr:hypothetical protein [Saprospiraceae bacterium]
MSKFKQDPRLRRLEMEHELLQDFCSQSELITFEPLNQRPGFPPESYKIHFRVKTITAIDSQQKPVYGELHTAEISLPNGYPMTSSPICYMRTPVWHPNIRSSGEYRGHICINAQVLGHWHTLDMLIEQIGKCFNIKTTMP